MLDPLLFGQKTAPDFFWDARGGVLPPGATFTRGSSGWFFNSAGVLTQAGSNVARFDYDPSTLMPCGYFAEPQSTNNVTWSQKFTDASWVATGVTVTDNVQASPDGTTDAATLKEDSTTNARGVQWATLSVTIANVYGLSIFAKNISGSRWLQLNMGGGQGVNFNPSTGAIGNLNGTGVAQAVARQLANGWWRFSVLITASATVGTSFRLYMVQSGTDGNAPSYAGDGASTIAVFGAQADTAGLGVTSYIPTAGSTVTRSADILSLPLTSVPGWNASKGGVLVAPYRMYTQYAGEMTAAAISDAAQNNAVAVVGSNGGNNAVDVWSGGGRQVLTSGAASPAFFVRRKQAIGWSTNRVQVAHDGNFDAGSSGTYALPVNPTTLYVGSWSTAGYLNGTIESIAYYAGARSDAFVQQMSR